MDSVVRIGPPLFASDTITFGLLMAVLGLIFYATTMPRFKKFFSLIPALLLCYFIPSILTTVGLISPGWFDLAGATEMLQAAGVQVTDGMHLGQLKTAILDANVPSSALKPYIHESQLYYVASRFLLPACLVLLTLSIDLKEVFKLGPKALTMFLTGTAGVIIGGPLAILIVSAFAPDVVGGVGPNAVWRGMATVAGSWIGGGANQAAMEVLFQPSGKLFSQMIAVDIIVAEIWMFFLLLGVGKHERIDAWFKADSSSVDHLKVKMEEFSQSIARIPTFVDLMVILGLGFGATSLSHWLGGVLAEAFEKVPGAEKFSLTSSFFWLIVLATTAGIVLSFTNARNYEGAGASRVGTAFIYVLVATIGMKMDVLAILENPGIFLVGAIWMCIHVALLLIVGKAIKAPFFFLAVGSKANIGGAASAPVVAGAFHPALAPVGVLLAVVGYALGTYGAWICAKLMQAASGG
ncbi:MAG: DUF819 family protein [Candidatus Eremiobacteraeota bacterium]|nr:DUF819 family protein [Candidatus Eremiobacteraeota bacterium]